MKVHLVNYEQELGMNGILTKYAKSMERELDDLGHKVTVSGKPQKADINHHINFISYQPSGGKDTVMITHLSGDANHTEKQKIEIAKECLKTAHGICMNPGLMKKLIKAGVPKNKLDFVYHAHDNIKRRPRLIAIVTNVYPDGRKREEMFTKLFQSFKNKKDVAFRIMGKGWMPILDPLVTQDLQIQYANQFTGDLYLQMLNTSDYLLYFGDEDSLAQSVVDAVHLGLKVIAPPSEDLKIDFPFKNQKELNDIFEKMVEDPTAEWTWENYAKNHLKIWQKLCKK